MTILKPRVTLGKPLSLLLTIPSWLIHLCQNRCSKQENLCLPELKQGNKFDQRSTLETSVTDAEFLDMTRIKHRLEHLSQWGVGIMYVRNFSKKWERIMLGSSLILAKIHYWVIFPDPDVICSFEKHNYCFLWLWLVGKTCSFKVTTLGLYM